MVVFYALVIGMLVSPILISSIPPDTQMTIPESENVSILADDYHSNHNFIVGTLDHDTITWSLYSHDGIYGDFEVIQPASGGDKIITFFICDQENYDLWDSGESASVYHLQENVGEYSFHFRIPSQNTWYFVFVNYAILTSKTINLDLYRDETPPSIDMNLDAGASYSGVKEITASVSEAQFEIDDVKLYIDGYLVDTESDSSFSYSWNTASYSNGAHTVRLTASDNVGNSGYEEVTVYTSNAVTTSPTTAGGGGDDDGDSLNISPTFMLLATLGIVALIVVAGIVSRSRGGQ